MIRKILSIIGVLEVILPSSSRERKEMLVKKHWIRIPIILLSFLCLFGTLPLTSSFASASSASGNPFVIIAQDTTASSHCQITFRQNIGTPREKTIQTPCAAGSDITTSQVPLSVARSHHWAYVLLSSSISAQTSHQIDQLVRDTRAAAVHTSKVVAPQSTFGCGNGSTETVLWHPRSNPSITLRGEQICAESGNGIIIGTIGIELLSSGYAYWVNFNYAYTVLDEHYRYVEHNNYVTDCWNCNYNYPFGKFYSPEWQTSPTNTYTGVIDKFQGAQLY